MCGIIGVYVVEKERKELVKTLIEIYKNQRERGNDGFGYAIRGRGVFKRERFTDDYSSFMSLILDLKDVVKDMAVIYHHRLPTSTSNGVKFNHPLTNCKENMFLIHNGIIWGYREHYERLKETHKFETEGKVSTWYYSYKSRGKTVFVRYEDGITDSEIITHYLEDYIEEGKLKEGIRKMSKEIDGSYAMAFILSPKVERRRRIYLLRHSNPIWVYQDKKGNTYFSSEKPHGFKNYYELGQGEFGYIDKSGYHKIMIIKELKYEERYEGYGKYESVWEEYNNSRLDDELSEKVATYLGRGEVFRGVNVFHGSKHIILSVHYEIYERNEEFLKYFYHEDYGNIILFPFKKKGFLTFMKKLKALKKQKEVVR